MLKVPPFRDSHMHFFRSGKPVSLREAQNLKDRYARNGVLSVRDMGHASGIGLDTKRAPGPVLDVQTAGYALYRKGTYGAFLGEGVSGCGEIRKSVREIADAGADFLKVINSGIVSPAHTGSVTEGGFSAGELGFICAGAAERGLDVACHANSDAAIRNAVEAGVSSIEHGYFISRETLHLMAEKGVSWTPTVFALRVLSSILSPAESACIDEIIEGHLSSIHYASTIGVKLRVGTDSGSRGVHHGESFFDELLLFREAGLLLEQILAAACMGREEIDKGNYLVVKEDFIASRKIEAVFRGGVRISAP